MVSPGLQTASGDAALAGLQFAAARAMAPAASSTGPSVSRPGQYGRWCPATPKAHSPPRLRGWPATPASETGCPPTQRARTPHPAGQMEQFVNLAEISPRGGRGTPGQFSLHSAVSVINRHGAGVNTAPAAAPPMNFSAFLRVFCIFRPLLMAIQATVRETLPAMASDAV